MKRRDVVRELEKLGYTFIREGDEHSIYGKPGKRLEQVPRHREIDERTGKEILKRARRT